MKYYWMLILSHPIIRQGCRKVWKPGRACSKEMGIMCHPGWDRVTWSAKNSCQSMIYWSTLQLQTYWHKYQNLTWFGSSLMNVSTIKILPVFTNVVRKLVISSFLLFSISYTRTATEMDGTLHTDFRKSETSRDIKKKI